MMNLYKKIMAVAVFATVSFSAVVFADRCQSCAEKMAIKQSIKDALAAAIAANTVVARDQAVDNEIEKCGCSKPKPKPGRAVHNDVVNSADIISESTCCLLSQQLQDIACANEACCKVVHRINDKLKEQGRDAKKCCHKIKEKLEDVQDLLLSQADDLADCCSVTEALLVSVIDQDADCCSVIEARIGDFDAQAFSQPPANRNEVKSFVDNTDADIMTWLKSLYEIALDLYQCCLV